jgi:hypothetical protein
MTYDVKQELVKENCRFSEGWGHKLEDLVDGENNTYMHTNYAPTESNPVIVEVKLGSEITANRLIFDGSHNSENKFLPKDFKIYVSSDGENWQLACNVTGSELSSDGWQVTADFDNVYTFSYYKIEITATHNQYIALRKIILQHVIENVDGKQITLDNSMFKYDKEWTTKAEWSTFGHVYVGKKDATVEFEFDGTRFAIISSAKLGSNFKVEIDGKEVSSIDLIENSSIGASFMSDKLTSGKHTVKITCLEDDDNIDSIVIW